MSRPDPGLGRGVWEARPAVIGALASVVVALALAYGATRLGFRVRRRPKKQEKQRDR